ncbi:MAG: ATP-grasp domain-containing protein [Myxococcota bacterium]|nr:ATP-grasp domain-containing protein [Myxococcota bacterium]
MKALVTGLFTQAGLFAVRRFGELGFKVTAVDNHPLAFGLYSRYVERRVILPSLREDPLRYARYLIKELEEGGYEYYFPAFEESFVLSDFRSRIEACTRTVLQPRGDILRLHDKNSMRLVAEACGVRTPETFAPRSLEEARSISREIDFPVYIKMRKSRNSTGLRLVDDPAKIWETYEDVIHRNELDDSQLPLVQRRIQGPEVVLSLLAQEGRIVGAAPYRGIRSIPRSGGTTTCRQAISAPRIEGQAAQLVSHVGWTGFMGMDFIIDDRTQTPYLIDCNPRASVGINVAKASGLDLLQAWMRIADGEVVSALPPATAGSKTATEFADVIWYFDTFIKGPQPWAERAQMRKRWRCEQKEVEYDIFSRKDFLPMLVLLVFLFVQTLKLLWTKTEASELFLYYNLVDEQQYLRKRTEVSRRPQLQSAEISTVGELPV